MPLSAFGTVLYSMQELDVAELLVTRGIRAVAVVDQLAILDTPMLGEIGPLLLEVLDLLVAGQLHRAVGIEPMPARKVFAVEDRAETSRRIGFRGLQGGELCEQDRNETEV